MYIKHQEAGVIEDRCKSSQPMQILLMIYDV